MSRARARAATAARIVVTATPVTRSTRSGSHCAGIGQRSSKPEVRSAMKLRSAYPSVTARWSMPSARAASVPGRSLQVQPTAVERLRGGRGQAGVGDHEPAGVGRAHEVCEEGRHRLGGVGAEEQHRMRRPDVGHGERKAPVEAEAPDPRRRGRAHAPATVVVDLAGAERDPRELAQLVGLLVRRPPPPKTATASRPYAACVRTMPSATTSSASSHDAGTSSPSRRTRGVVSRPGVRRSSALVQPFWHRPPRLVGNRRGVTVRSAADDPVRVIAHCRPQ